MNHLEHNRKAWNQRAAAGDVWSTPVPAEIIAQARAGRWQIVLTPSRPVPMEWFGELCDKDVLCLASGGGQQAPVLAAAGARVVSFDLADDQLALDQRVAEREGLSIRCVRGDMTDLSAFADASFDLVFHPVSNVFIPELARVWRECHRVLRPGGALLAGFMNPALFMFDHDEADRSGELIVRHTLPYSDLACLAPEVLQAQVARGEALNFGHSLEAQLGGQIDAGFAIVGLYEDQGNDASWVYSRHGPVAVATRALKTR